MKPILLILLLLSAENLLAANLSKSKTDKKKPSEVQGDVVINDKLDKMLKVNGVNEIYEKCKKDPNYASLDKIPTCIWNGVKSKPDMKAEVMKIYVSESKGETKSNEEAEKKASGGRAPASADDDKASLTAREKNVGINYESDPAVAALSKFYGDKLMEVLDPAKALTKAEQDEGKILTVDHRKFNDLYKSELGKTIISAFTSYCLDTDPRECNPTTTPKKECTLRDKQSDREADRKTNLDSLKGTNADFSSNSPQSKKWQYCIVSVSDICNKGIGNDESKKRSCLIVDYVQAARKNLMIVDKQAKFYNDMSNDGIRIASNTVDIKDEEKTSADSLLEMTGKDVKDTLKESTKTSLKEMDECYDDTKGAITNVEKCKKFLNTNTKDNEDAVAEFGMRQLAQQETLEDELKKSDTKVGEYLKEEGYSEKDIKDMTADKANIDKVRDQIIERFKNQKEAIIKEMAARIEDKSSKNDGKIDKTDDLNKIQKIRTEIAGRADDLAGLVQFNNIVASYLMVGEAGGKTKQERNTASLFAEIKTMDEKESKDMLQKTKAADLKNKKTNTELSVDTLNSSFLEYDQVKPAKKVP